MHTYHTASIQCIHTSVVHVRTHNIHIIDVLLGIDLYSFTCSPVYWELRSYLSKLLPTAGLGAVDDVIDNLKEVLTTRKQAQCVQQCTLCVSNVTFDPP